MAENKFKRTPDSSAEWLAYCGFIFPSTKKELTLFNEVMGEVDPLITGEEVDPFRIVENVKSTARRAKIARMHFRSSEAMVAKSQDDDSAPSPPREDDSNEPDGSLHNADR